MLSNPIHLILFILLLQMFFGFFEFVRPAALGQSFKGRIKNFAFTSIYIFLGGFIAIGAAEIFSMKRIISVDMGTLRLSFLILLFFFVKDLFFYWYHRFEHSSPTFWPIHELHHSDEDLNSSTSMRSHWLENPIQFFFIVFPATLIIGTNVWLAYIFPIFEISWLFFTHSNIKFRFGSITPVITGPQLHRIHHSILPEHQNKNYAQFFPVIDIIFGTYYQPKKDEFPKTGVDSMVSDVPILKASLKPFYAWIPSKKYNKD